MKALLCLCTLFILDLPAFADTYTGIVSEVKHFHSGGVAVDLDGAYPNQKMTFYVSPNSATTVGAMPPEGAKVTAKGEIESYNGKPEIKIKSRDQWSW